MRLDGYFCDYVEKDKLNFLRMLNDNGVKNIEMESTAFASYTSRAGFKGPFFLSSPNRFFQLQLSALLC